MIAFAGACAGEPDTVEVADIANSVSESAENGLDRVRPEDALQTVLAALREEGSFQVSGTMLNGGAIDIRYVVGEGAVGTVVDPGGDAPVEVLAVDGRIYVTGDDEFLAESLDDDVDETVAGKWLLLRADSTAAFEVIADGERFVEAVLAAGSEVEMTGVRELDGVPVIGLRFADSGATLWVAAAGAPLPVRFEEKGASADAGILWFTQLDDELELDLPDSEDVIDADELDSANEDEDSED